MHGTPARGLMSSEKEREFVVGVLKGIAITYRIPVRVIPLGHANHIPWPCKENYVTHGMMKTTYFYLF